MAVEFRKEEKLMLFSILEGHKSLFFGDSSQFVLNK